MTGARLSPLRARPRRRRSVQTSSLTARAHNGAIIAALSAGEVFQLQRKVRRGRENG